MLVIFGFIGAEGCADSTNDVIIIIVFSIRFNFFFFFEFESNQMGNMYIPGKWLNLAVGKKLPRDYPLAIFSHGELYWQIRYNENQD